MQPLLQISANEGKDYSESFAIKVIPPVTVLSMEPQRITKLSNVTLAVANGAYLESDSL